MAWRIGTMGFSYPDWEGVFYPAGMKPGEFLAEYARHFDALELDTTFHATPPPERMRHWASVTPDDFRFCVKTPKQISHATDVGDTPDAMRQFIDVARELGPKLAVILIQFSPSFSQAQRPGLQRLLASLPTDVRFAVEFRHSSWSNDEAADFLREHRCCFVAGDDMSDPWPIRVTADFLYVRWIGIHNRFPIHDREAVDVSQRLAWWKDQLDAATRAQPNVRDVWGFFNNDFSGYSIGAAERMKRLLGQAIVPATPPVQGELFKLNMKPVIRDFLNAKAPRKPSQI